MRGQDPDDARLAVHQAVREGDTRVGGADDSDPGDDRRVAEGPGSVAVPRSDLLVRGHHAADARGGTNVSDRRQQLAIHHEEHRPAAACKKST